MKARILNLGAAALLTAVSAWGVPAKPGYHTMTLADGSSIEVEMVGDEAFHFFRSADGRTFVRGEEGTLCAIDATRLAQTRRKAVEARKAPVEIARTFPTTGTVRGLVILAEFPECRFGESSTKEYFHRKINELNYDGDETFGSVADFFAEQSQGRFTPVFDVVGPVMMPHSASYYANAQLDLSAFFRDLCQLADKECDVDFSQYDIDNDGFVDFVFSIFAGHSQAQSLNTDDIWPAMQYLSSYVFDLFDNKYLNVAACASEYRGADGSEPDGIGTIVHEFSHILGLPDIYDPLNSGYGMGHFDIMDIGTYNGEGKIPSGYTAMDRYTLGWLEPTVLEGDAREVELSPLIDSNEALFIVNPENEAEFFTLENRQQTGFDSGLPAHGLLVTQVHYDPKVWKNNIVNSPQRSGYEHVTLVAADNRRDNSTEAGDTYPGLNGVTEFSAAVRSSLAWHTTSNAFDTALTDIREDASGNVLFNFGSTAGVADVIAVSQTAEIYTLDGRRVYDAAPAPGLYIVRAEGKTSKMLIR